MLNEIPGSVSNGKAVRPLITSYDSGYEHSLEHHVYVRRLVVEADEEFLEPAPEAGERGIALASGFAV